jgi:hypothetical protein
VWRIKNSAAKASKAISALGAPRCSRVATFSRNHVFAPADPVPAARHVELVVAHPHELTKEWAYTALSRGKGRTDLRVIDDGEGPPVTLQTIQRAMTRSQAHELASRQINLERDGYGLEF